MNFSVNRTNTNIEAYFHYFAGKIEKSTKYISNQISEGLSEKVSTAIKFGVWAHPIFTFRIAPIPFAVTMVIGGISGIFSRAKTEQILGNINAILDGGAHNKDTNVKASLIFFIIISEPNLPKRFALPSIYTFYGALAGFIFGLEASKWITPAGAKSIAEFIDQWIPFLPTCPGFVKEPSADSSNPEGKPSNPETKPHEHVAVQFPP